MSIPLLYIKSGCPWCNEVIAYFKQHDIEVEAVLVSGNPKAMDEMVALSGQSKAPTMNWHGKLLADFGVEELVPFLEQQR